MDTLQEILAHFQYVARHPKAQLQNYLSQGKQVVACVPVYTPYELIHSMDLLPFGAWGADMEIREAKEYFPAFICSIMQTILELGMTGAYAGISAIVIPSLCDSLKCLGQNWKYAVPSIPFIPMTYPQNRNNVNGRAFTVAGYQRVIADLTTATGKKFSEAALADSILVFNRHNSAMRRLADVLAGNPVISALQRNDIYKSAYFMEREEHTELVLKLTDLLLAAPKPSQTKKKIVISGIIADNPEMLAIFDQNNLQIVADDLAHESRQYRVDTDETMDPLMALADKFARMDHCSVLYDVEKKRGTLIAGMVKKYQADGVVFLLTKFCDPEEFDYPILKKQLDQEQIPSILIETDRQMTNYSQAATAILAFTEMLA